MLDLIKHAPSGAPVEYIPQDRTVAEALHAMMARKVGHLVVKDAGDRIVGFVTQRDLLRCIARASGDPESLLFNPAKEPHGWNCSVREIMTLSKDLIFLTPNDTLEDARALMSVSGKRHIPVLAGSTLLGVISPKLIAQVLHLQRPDVQRETAKKSYVSTVIPRKGMPIGTKAKQDAEDSQLRLAIRSAVCNLPHPHKKSLGEDAFLLGPHMVGVADGVGSWWEHGVDPSEYPRGLMHAALHFCEQHKADLEVRPSKVLQAAWHKMQSVGTVGSSTACLVSLHPHTAELLAANVGDSGFIILRRNEALGGGGRAAGARAAVSGTLDVAAAAAAVPTRSGSGSVSVGSHHVAFRSPQQLRAFNAPFQLGHAPDVAKGAPDSRFETPQDAALVRVPVRGGDVIVLASDGLFDNMPEAAVLSVFEKYGDAPEEDIARHLATQAQELSLDRHTDSPFAILAKENDILWGGGRPDDITVIVSSIVDTSVSAAPPTFASFTGPGPAPKWADEPEPEPAGAANVNVPVFEEWA
jgi:protein phosphatase PTC7